MAPAMGTEVGTFVIIVVVVVLYQLCVPVGVVDMSKAKQLLSLVNEAVSVRGFLKGLKKKAAKALKLKPLKKNLVAAIAKKLAMAEGKVNEMKAGAVDLGNGWVRYFDGGAGVFFAKASVQEVEDFVDSQEAQGGDVAAPFKTVVNDGDEFLVYMEGEREPTMSVSREEIISQLKGEYEDSGEEGEYEPDENDVIAAALAGVGEL